MTEPLKLMTIFAHPDDESMGTGSTLARYSEEGVKISSVCATRGQKGWFRDPKDYPGPEELGRLREAELHAAAGVLGIQRIYMLDYIDGELDKADPQEVTSSLAAILRMERPQVVITFGPDGQYGHPDHIAISQLAAAAVVLAAGADFNPKNLPSRLDGEHLRHPHLVSKLYYLIDTSETLKMYERFTEDLVMKVDGEERRPMGWEDWAVTTRIEGGDYWKKAWQAVQKHESQVGGYEKLMNLPEAFCEILWGRRVYYRAFSLVNGGRSVETDLFQGLR
jgi:LmbE family N-acetylglucosaminyl deacetylase